MPHLSTVIVAVALPRLGNAAAGRAANAEQPVFSAKRRKSDSLVLGTLLRHAEELRLVGLVAAVVVAVAEVGRLKRSLYRNPVAHFYLYADVGIGAADAHTTTVDWQAGTGRRALIGDCLIVTVIVAVAHL